MSNRLLHFVIKSRSVLVTDAIDKDAVSWLILNFSLRCLNEVAIIHHRNDLLDEEGQERDA